MKEKVIYALGFFDGVHLGHAALLTACHRLAEKNGCKAGVVTFSSHPDTLVTGQTPRLINTMEDRQRLLSGYGIRNITVLPFDKALMNMPWQEFLKALLQKDAAGFVCGSDFRFGYKGEGTADILAQHCLREGLPCAVVPEQRIQGIPVSSTYIRQLIEHGDMAQAVEFLGHPHILTGTVVSGRKLGRTLGIPTANIALPEGILCPKSGVYICKAIADGMEYMAVTNVGTRPTVGGRHLTVEPWLLDFEGDLYGKTLTLLFYDFIRPEQQFDSLVDLTAEIQKNAEKTRDFFKKT